MEEDRQLELTEEGKWWEVFQARRATLLPVIVDSDIHWTTLISLTALTIEGATSYLLGVTIIHSNPLRDGVRVDEAVVGLVSGYWQGHFSVKSPTVIQFP
jgi:hypothetical protein